MAEPRRTILVADDEADMLSTVSANLELDGYQVLEAANGEEAVRLVSERPEVDLVLSDIRMPGLDGVGVLGHVRQMRPGLPVILMTAFALREREEQALRSGVFALLHKPFDMEGALHLIRRALSRPAVLVMAPPDERARIRQVFESNGHSTLACQTTAEALATVASRAVDVVLVDLTFAPDALQVVQRLSESDPALRIIVLTQEFPGQGVERDAPLEVSAWVRRPFADLQLVLLALEVRGRKHGAQP
jgi:CheY-like chemotaxis protein